MTLLFSPFLLKPPNPKLRNESSGKSLKIILIAAILIIGFVCIWEFGFKGNRLISSILVLFGTILAILLRHWIKGVELRPISASAYILFIFLAGFVIAMEIGTNYGKNKKEYAIILKSPELVILKKYGDLLFCSCFNADSMIIEGPIITVDIKDLTKYPLIVKGIGPLRWSAGISATVKAKLGANLQEPAAPHDSTDSSQGNGS
jgi:hypothetical protein